MNKKKSILIIQLTRIGDIIQTFQSAFQLKNENNDISISLICRKEFGEGLYFLLKHVFDKVYFLDIKKTLSTDISFTKNFLKEINNQKFDELYNFSFSKASSYLTSLISAKKKHGIYRNNKNEIVIEDRISQFIYASVLGSSLTPFNLIDLFSTTLGVKELGKSFTAPSGKKNKKIIIHPFASSSLKRFKTQKWIDILSTLLKENPNYHLYLVGGKEDINEANLIKNASSLKIFSERLNIFVGFTSVETTYELISEASLFIGHDSMVSHLTSFFNIPSLVIALGPVRPLETAPYNNQAIILSSKKGPMDLMSYAEETINLSHNDISIKTIAKIAKDLLNNIEITEESINKINIFEKSNTRFSKINLTKEHGVILTALDHEFLTLKETFTLFYALLWSYILREKDFPANVPKLNKNTKSELKLYQDALQKLFDIYEYGVIFSARLIKDSGQKTKDLNLIQDSISKITELSHLAETIRINYPLLSPLINFIELEKLNGFGHNIETVAYSNSLAFKDGQTLISSLTELIENTTQI